jgi:hypothetical protein
MQDITIKIGVAKFRQQRALQHGEEAPEGAEIIPTGTGAPGIIETIDEPSETTITIPGVVVERMIAENREIGGRLSPSRLIADHIEKVMVHHSDQEHWTSLSVVNDPEKPSDFPDLEKYLQTRILEG